MNYILKTISSILVVISALLTQIYYSPQTKFGATKPQTKFGLVIPLNATYRIGMRHRYDYISCNGDYLCNKQAFQNNLITHPQIFSIWEEIPSDTGRGFEIIVWEEFSALTLTDAINKMKQDTLFLAEALLVKDPATNTFVKLYDFGAPK